MSRLKSRYFGAVNLIYDLFGGLEGKVSDCNAGDPGLTPPCWEDSLEKEMGIHSSTLAWKIPWMEDSGRL